MPTTDNGSRAHSHLLIDALQHSKPQRARFEEWRQGGIGCVHVTLAVWEDARRTLTTIGEWHELLRQNADLIALARSADDIERINASGRSAILFGFQNASPIEDELNLLRIFHELGVRIVQLTYNVQNHVGSGCWETNDSGLSTYFGRNVVREMNELGMLVDISHCGERTSMDAIEYSSAPIAATHANPTEFVGPDIELRNRTKSTAVIRSLAERGGVVGLSPYPRMMRDGPSGTLDTFLDMVAWTVELIGIDHVGFGTDYYVGYPDEMVKWWRAGRWARESPVPITGGLVEWPAWFQSPAQFPSVLEGLSARGFSQAEVAQLSGANWLRLFRETFEPSSSRSAAG